MNRPYLLTIVNDQVTLQSGIKDCITKTTLEAGDLIIVCKQCKLSGIYLEKNWNGTCAYCGGTETMQFPNGMDEVFHKHHANSQNDAVSKYFVAMFGEIKKLQLEIEEVKTEVGKLSSFILNDNSNNNNTYIRKLSPLQKKQIDIISGKKIKIGQFLWLVLDINSVGEVRLFCEEIADVIDNYGQYDRYDRYSCLDRIFSNKEIVKYHISDLQIPSKNDVEKAISLKMAKTDSFWVIGNLIYQEGKLLKVYDSIADYGFRPILTIDSKLFSYE